MTQTETAKHTPGPWSIDERYAAEPVQEVYGPSCLVAEARCGFVPQTDSDKKRAGKVANANARLIAAAPDLLAACKAQDSLIAKLTLNLDESDGQIYRESLEVDKLARGAIQMAEGGAA